MDSHVQGPVDTGSNYGSIFTQRLFPVRYNDTTERELLTIVGSTESPVLLELGVHVSTVFNAAGNDFLTVGPSDDSDGYIDDLPLTATGFRAVNAFGMTAFGAPTGTLTRTTFATYAGQDISASPTEAEVQAIDDHVKILSERLAALITDWGAYGPQAIPGAKQIVITSRVKLVMKYTYSSTAPTTGAGLLIVRIAGAGNGNEITY